ncbi:calcium-binding protein [Phaeobacter gallaeciensis]|uniref:calcium-binding protein n=1 Tax=Phaeobacter gallaeciensis TaxID=60890 RepID=UPI00237FAB17|nr:calcium-binding protein [Phaeobacter gallaeciensis]MDE4305943.1 calcium-binding protein [Phaeobacter gallaeciensis]MDE4310292.1 calcium-binding protein [Phaeobacter gallaeciensis]MDE4314594.1 calcium-binding protein [Phaeobacter gallaeciensis]MDE4319221.1 calcium-binding protein [Phaeobacter gallaeciensis]MDE4323960.1 calcium-binding protein [Phaeobacter gallaeciensis]
MADSVSTSGGAAQGDLYGDLWVLTRDLDPSDGGGNGEPVLDENGQIVPIGYNPETGETFPIHLVEGGEGEYEVPADQLDYIQEIEMERANIMRSPDQVVESALEEALGKINAGTEITTDASGRIMVDGVLIDSPRENLALYKLIMTAGGATSWTEVQANVAGNIPQSLIDLMNAGWNPTGLLAGVFSKFHPVSMDATLTAHTFMGVNEVTGSGDTQTIDYFGFTDGSAETFDYDRIATYGDAWVQWYQDMDGDPSDLEAVQRTLLDVIWGKDRNGDGVNDVGTGKDWVDGYMTLSADGESYEMAEGSAAGINDWAQSVEDAREAIYVLHEYVGTTEIAAPEATDDVIEGSSYADYIASWGGNDLITGDNGDDLLDGGDGDDTLKGNRGDDSLEGGAGNDVVRGGFGYDAVVRGSGDDKVFGGRGSDKLNGGAGDDTMDGGAGDDILRGGRGADFLTGGDGADDFFFRLSGPRGTDTIADFASDDLDIIRLDRIDADSSTEEDDAFTFIGSAHFSGTAGELRAADRGDFQRIVGDVDGDGNADFVIKVLGSDAAEADWFAL